MKNPKLLTLFAVVAIPVVLSACNRYQFTLNEQVVHTPPPLLTHFQLQDSGLQQCTDQTIKDRSIHAADQLTLLNCSNGAISTTQGLEIFSQLKTLNLANNALSDINALLMLPRLQAVNLAGNPDLDCQVVSKLAQQVSGELIAPKHCTPQAQSPD